MARRTRSRARAAALLALAGAVASGAAPAVSNAACPTSRTAGVTVLAKSRYSIAYMRKDRPREAFGCLGRYGRERALPGGLQLVSPAESGSRYRSVDRPLLEGRYVGYVYTTAFADAEEDIINVYDLKLGKLRLEQGTGFFLDDDWTMKKNGVVAWISPERDLNSQMQRFTGQRVLRIQSGVRYPDRPAQPPRTLDVGNIGRTSLERSADNTTLSWTKDGQRRTAPFS